MKISKVAKAINLNEGGRGSPARYRLMFNNIRSDEFCRTVNWTYEIF